MRVWTPLVLLVMVGCTTMDQTSVKPPLDAVTADATTNEAVFSATGVHRLEPRYPIEDARAGRDGCATVRYMLTPEHQLLHVEVMEASTRSFGRESVAAVSRWDLSALPAGTVVENTWFDTRFEFCIETAAGKCDVEQLHQNTQCPGENVVPVVGYLVRSRAY